jgi:hypothetical protein
MLFLTDTNTFFGQSIKENLKATVRLVLNGTKLEKQRNNVAKLCIFFERTVSIILLTNIMSVGIIIGNSSLCVCVCVFLEDAMTNRCVTTEKKNPCSK